jgi:CBS domain-containing protein
MPRVLLIERPVSELMRPPTWVDPDTPITVAARLMTEANQSCVLFRTPEGIGIMTDSDCRRRVATGDVPPGAPVGAIGTVPAREVSVTTTAAESFLEMVTHGVHHMVVTDARGTPVGVARVFDLSSAEIRDPLVVRRAIDNATDLAALAEACALLPPTAVELADAGVPALRVGALLGVMVEAVVERCVSFEPELARTESSWLVLGSLARHEPLPASDVDTALVWSAPEGAPEPDRDGLLAAAERVIESFERCGLRRCVDGANASNSLFNRSHPAWLAAIGHWVESPDGPGALLLSSIVCDSRPLTGLPLGRSLTAALETDRTSRAFLTRMLREALALRPPTGFVREFVVEAGGDHRGELDLKRRGLGPVVALGR